MFNLDVSISPQKKGRGGWLARKFHSRSKFSISIEISNFFDLWALWVTDVISGLMTDFLQTKPWGGGKKRGVENLTYDTPPKKGFRTPPSHGTFSTPLRCQCSVFHVQKSTIEQTRSSFGGVQKFSGERVLWYVFLPPYVLHPPISRPNFCG